MNSPKLYASNSSSLSAIVVRWREGQTMPHWASKHRFNLNCSTIELSSCLLAGESSSRETRATPPKLPFKINPRRTPMSGNLFFLLGQNTHSVYCMRGESIALANEDPLILLNMFCILFCICCRCQKSGWEKPIVNTVCTLNPNSLFLYHSEIYL